MTAASKIGPEFGWFPHWVVRDPVWATLSRSARLVYFRICDQAEHVGRKVWVARSATRYIAKLEAMHHDTVGLAVVELIEAGLIERANEPKRGRIPQYRLVTSKVRFRAADYPVADNQPPVEMSDSPAISDVGFRGSSEGRDVGYGGHIEEPSTAASSDEGSAGGPSGPQARPGTEASDEGGRAVLSASQREDYTDTGRTSCRQVVQKNGGVDTPPDSDHISNVIYLPGVVAPPPSPPHRSLAIARSLPPLPPPRCCRGCGDRLLPSEVEFGSCDRCADEEAYG